MARTGGSSTRPRRSAFAAAFLSFLLPGLGHAYLGRWLRAAVWLILPIITIAALAAVLTGPDRTEFFSNLIDPDMLLVALGIVLLDLLYRLAAVIDAWRLGRDRSVGSGLARTASLLGVAAVSLVLVLSHVAVAQPLLVARDIVGSLDGDGGDSSAIPDRDQLGRGFDHLRDEPGASGAPDASAAPGATPRADPTRLETLPPDPVEDPWTGTERLDILLVGIDSGRRNQPTFLTDTMMVVSIDPKTGRLAFISLPRDTVGVPLPAEWTAARSVYGSRFPGRINSLYTTARLQERLFKGNDKQRGYKALMGALSELYGLDIQHYVSVDLKGFRGAVNALGGLIVDVDRPLLDPGYPADDGRGHLKLYVPPGIQYMNGQQALAFARSRKTTSDFDRADRQQLLVSSVREQLDLQAILSPGVIAPLFREYQAHVTTNIPAKLLPKLVTLGLDVKFDKPRSLVLSPARGFSVENDSYELVPNIPRIRNAVQNVFKSGSKKKPSGG